MAKKKTGTTQLGLRLDNEVLDRVEALAEFEGIDRSAWIKRAVGIAVSEADDIMQKEAIESYIQGVMTEEELKDIMSLEKIPKDLKEARKERLNKIIHKEED